MANRFLLKADDRYAWQPGYWAAGQSDWDWVPAHYVWTPRGYVFVDGYYDYSVARRGVLFAPVYFSSGIYAQSGFSYSPAMVISPAMFDSMREDPLCDDTVLYRACLLRAASRLDRLSV